MTNNLIQYISYEEVLDVYARTIDKSGGGFSGIRDEGGIKAVIDFVQNDTYYPDFASKLSYLVFRLCSGHFFNDGNKRIAATLFIYFLNFYRILYKNGKQVIDNNTLTALTLLIAESNPKEKEVIIDLVMNFLNIE